MPVSPTKFIKRCAQWRPKSEASLVSHGTRGVYALLQFRGRGEKYDVVYIGMAASRGIRSRLKSYKKSETKIWPHFSIVQIWGTVGENEVESLEGLFREV